MSANSDPLPHDPAIPASSADAAAGRVHAAGTASSDGSSVGEPAQSQDASLGAVARALGSALRREGRTRFSAAKAGLAGGAAAASARARAMRGGTADPQQDAPPAPLPRPVRRRRAPGSRSIRFGWRLFIWSIFLLVFASSATVVAVWLAMRDLPLADVLPPLEAPNISVETADGQVLTTQGAYRAPYVGLDEFPPHLAQAVMAIEDRRFREHSGVDFRGIARAMVRNVSAGGVVEGGSTLTHQLV